MRRYDKEILKVGKKLEKQSKGYILKGEKRKRNKRKKRAYTRIPRTYNVYIKSKHWTQRKNKYFQIYGRVCECCESAQHIHLHHMVYRNSEFGRERASDLIAFCYKCHVLYHKVYGTQGNMKHSTLEFVTNTREMLGLPLTERLKERLSKL